MEKEKHILIIAGEASGDLNAANLISAIKEIEPAIKFSGVGGTLMRQAGLKIYCDIKGLSVIGLFDALLKLPKFFALQWLILKKTQEEKPDAIILVDFSGFNLRLAKKIHKALPVIYYTSPQIWASRRGRIKTIKKYVDRMLVFFKFEEEFYRRQGINAEFIGHPLLDTVHPSLEKEEFLNSLGLSEAKKTIALLPGSRAQEIKNILPVMLEAGFFIRKEMPDTQFLLAKSPQVELEVYRCIIGKYALDLKIVEAQTYDCLQAADFALVASGTATLETAILEKPFVVIYKMSLLNYLLYRPQVRVPYIGMVNIVAARRIVPEFIQFRAKPARIAQEVLRIMQQPQELTLMQNNLARVKASLGSPGASSRAARLIVDFLT